MPSFMNTLGAVSRRGQWRFRRLLRASDARGQVDISDDGLLDFSGCSEILIEVAPRASHRGWQLGRDAEPVLTASLSAGTVFVSNPGIVETVFADGALSCVPTGLYDVRILVSIGPETEQVFCEPIEIC